MGYNSIVKLFWASSLTLGGLVFDQCSGGAANQWADVLATAISSFAAGNTANAVEEIVGRKEKQKNLMLMDAVSTAIADIIREKSEEYQGEIHDNLNEIACQANNEKIKKILLERLTSIKKNKPELIEATIKQVTLAEDSPNLTIPEWEGILYVLCNEFYLEEFRVSDAIFTQIAEKLQNNFPEKLRTYLNKHLASNQTEFNEVIFELLRDIKKEVEQQGTQDSPEILDYLDQLSLDFLCYLDKSNQYLKQDIKTHIDKSNQYLKQDIKAHIEDTLYDKKLAFVENQKSSGSRARDIRPLDWSDDKQKRFFDALLQLDFERQRDSFRKILEKHRIVSFLIHGKPNCGQQLLMNCLYRMIPNLNLSATISINVTTNGIGRSPEILWQSIAEYFKEPRHIDPQSIREIICERLQNQSVIFIFSSVEYMILYEENKLLLWMDEFWKPLVEKAKQNLPQTDTRLLMFLVDHNGDVYSSKLPMTEPMTEREDKIPDLPIALPNVEQFSLEVLKKWIGDTLRWAEEEEEFSSSFSLTPETLFEKSDRGTPMYVLKEICNQYHFSLEGEITKWLY